MRTLYLNGGSADPTWTTGKFGAGLYFDGVDDNITSTHATLWDVKTTDNVTYEAWINLSGPTNSNGGYILGHGNGPTFFLDRVTDTTYRLGWFTLGPDFGDTLTYEFNHWYHVAVVKEGTSKVTFYRDGVVAGIVNTLTEEDEDESNMYIMGDSDTWRFNGILDELRYYRYARTPQQITQDMNAGHPAPGSPVGSPLGYWNYDTGYGSTLFNYGNAGSAFDGDITNATWTTDGKWNKGLVFNGSDSLVDLGVNTINSTIDGASAVTLETWMKPASYPGGTSRARMISVHLADGYSGALLSTYGTGSVEAAGRSDTSDTLQAATYALSDPNAWHHVVGVFDYPNDRILIYVDGKLVKTQSVTFTNTSYTAGTPTNNYDTLGAFKTTFNGDFYDGTLDDTKVYNFALTADQVRQEYNHGVTNVLGGMATDSNGIASGSADRIYCVPGDTSACGAPVAEWKLDEKQGQYAQDTSGNGFASILGSTTSETASDPSWVLGREGGALKFDGTDDYLELASGNADGLSITSGGITLEAWVRTNSDTAVQEIVYLGHDDGNYNNYRIELNGGKIDFDYQDISPFNPQTFESTSSYTWTDGWHHIAVSFTYGTGSSAVMYLDGRQIPATWTQGNGNVLPYIATGSITFRIGRAGVTWGNNYFDGNIDGIREFNYARTPAQIAWDYNRGAPAVQYNLDECQGTAIYNNGPTANGRHDSSYDGAIYPQSSGNTSVGTCDSGVSTEMWNDGTSGKYDASLGFDGTDDYASTGYDPNIGTGSFTVSLWLKTTDTGTNPYGAHTGSAGFEFYINGTGKIQFGADTGGSQDKAVSTTAINDGSWHHVVGEHDQSAGEMYIYIDGVLEDTTSITANSSGAKDFTGYPFFIGDDSYGTPEAGAFMSGQIDDVRMYTYPLTAAQVKTVYNGSAVSFGQ